MSPPPRVVFFTDSYEEANGIARLSHALEAYAASRDLPFLCVHGSRTTRASDHGGGAQLALRRSAASLRLEHDLTFDLLFWRHYRMVAEQVKAFRPDVLHITGPSDVGQLGAVLGHRLSIPMVGSWHTNLHQYAALRSRRWLAWLPTPARDRVLAAIERAALDATLLFYHIPRVLLAPNEELVALLARRTKKPTHLLSHGVETQVFSPEKRERHDSTLQIGFVGRLSAEKQVRLLPALERAIRAAGPPECQFVIVGDGTQREWLETQMPTAQFCGVLRGDALARAYANFDLFVFPSESETFGLVVLEAMASGVPVIAMARGGPGFVVEPGVSGFLAKDDRQFVDATIMVVRDQALRARLGKGARACALAWSWDAVFDRLYEVYADTARERELPKAFAAMPGTL
jgi:phosphatidylinositol alpha 1,6-mannosyltransferase